MAKTMSNIVLENVAINFRNFSGREGQYNRAGDRNFAIFLSEEDAAQMLEAGWNVKQLKPRQDAEPGDPQQSYISVAVGFNGRPPRIVLVTSRGKTPLTENEVDILDWADIRTTDVIIRPYEWSVSGKTGVKAYLQSIFVTINEDQLELKYADVMDTAQNSLPAAPAHLAIGAGEGDDIVDVEWTEDAD